MIKSKSYLFLLMLLIQLSSINGQAELGGTIDTIASDVSKLSASRKAAVTFSKFTVHELNVTGLSVKEYVANGKVFAVTWKGRKRIDVSQILGSYYGELKTASDTGVQFMPSHGKGRHPVSIHSSNVVFKSGGHMQSLYGLAYLQNGMPAAVTVSEIK